MPPSPVNTTNLDGAATAEPENQVPAWALVILWSASEPQRVGEISFYPPFEHRILGRRGESDIAKFAHFAPQRPGEPLAPLSKEALLGGDGISRRQLQLRATAVSLEMEVIGRCATFVNGAEKTLAKLKEWDTLMLGKQALLMCVRRPKVLAGRRAEHAFGRPDASGIVGESPATCALRDELAEAAVSDDHVLLRGESGTGKELAAAFLHHASKRAKDPFVSRSAATLPNSLIDAELFGNLANYPNPGMAARKGLVGGADGGTLFLDEIGELPLDSQTRLLRLMDEGEYTRLGETTARRANVRIIGATNQGDTVFRTDVRARFGWTIDLTPLRERREDIPLLLRHLLILRARKHPEDARFLHVGATGELEPKFSRHLVEYIVRQPLVANTRELRTFLRECVLASRGEDEVRLPSAIRKATTAPPAVSDGEDEEDDEKKKPSREIVLAYLKRARGNVSEAARRLGVHRNTFSGLMDKYGLTREETET